MIKLRQIFALIPLTFCTLQVKSQEHGTIMFFDKSGHATSEEQAYYYRQETDTTGKYRSYYASNKKLYFVGKISKASTTDENQNVYSGNCYWYYRNGNQRALRNFNSNGQEIGTSKYYFESGKLQKEVEYELGALKHSWYTEFDENGNKSRIFEETFSNNNNDWDLYSSDKSHATLREGTLELEALNTRGTSRFINVPIESDYYLVEGKLSLKSLKENDKAGIIYGFKDWQNYHYFAVSKKAVFIGTVYEGLNSVDVDAMFCSSLNEQGDNTIKILNNGEKIYFSVNGEVQYSDKANQLYGNNFGFVLSGNSKVLIDNLIIKEVNGRLNNTSGDNSEVDVKSSGSGLVFSTNGHILTNYHVVDGAKHFEVEVGEGSERKTYKAELLQVDKTNDLAILKISDPQFIELKPIEYSFKESGQIEVGGSVFTLGYPLALSGMGKEVKFTDGKISAKTGYEGALNSFQTSIPVQPGNSGGPVFNSQGQLIGIINASVQNTDNVSYAIKLNYVTGLIDVLSVPVKIPEGNDLSKLVLEEKIKKLSKYIALIKIK